MPDRPFTSCSASPTSTCPRSRARRCDFTARSARRSRTLAPALTHEPPHVAIIRADVAAGGDVLERAEQLRAELAAEARVPVDAVGVYAVC